MQQDLFSAPADVAPRVCGECVHRNAGRPAEPGACPEHLSRAGDAEPCERFFDMTQLRLSWAKMGKA